MGIVRGGARPQDADVLHAAGSQWHQFADMKAGNSRCRGGKCPFDFSWCKRFRVPGFMLGRSPQMEKHDDGFGFAETIRLGNRRSTLDPGSQQRSNPGSKTEPEPFTPCETGSVQRIPRERQGRRLGKALVGEGSLPDSWGKGKSFLGGGGLNALFGWFRMEMKQTLYLEIQCRWLE